MRPTRDEYFLNLLPHVAARATCPRRSVGCLLVDDQGRILATGYNGVPRDFGHCTDESPCPGRADQGGDNRRCLAIHAEQNAIMQCLNLDAVTTVYCSASPCFACLKMLLNLRALRRVCFIEHYRGDEAASALMYRRRNLFEWWTCFKGTWIPSYRGEDEGDNTWRRA